MVSIQCEERGLVDLITISGRIDHSNVSDLELVLRERIDRRRYRLVVNLSEVTFISSRPLRAIFAAWFECKKQGGNVGLVLQLSDPQGVILTLTGFPPILVFCDNTTAITSFAKTSAKESIYEGVEMGGFKRKLIRNLTMLASLLFFVFLGKVIEYFFPDTIADKWVLIIGFLIVIGVFLAIRWKELENDKW